MTRREALDAVDGGAVDEHVLGAVPLDAQDAEERPLGDERGRGHRRDEQERAQPQRKAKRSRGEECDGYDRGKGKEAQRAGRRLGQEQRSEEDEERQQQVGVPSEQAGLRRAKRAGA